MVRLKAEEFIFKGIVYVKASGELIQLERWHRAVQRRKYNVPGPNALWHIDGNHSLIHW